MFEIRQWRNDGNYFVVETVGGEGLNYLHSNGKIYHCAAEYWPTKAEAQAVLDKFQPKHEWEHGDIVKCDSSGEIMICLFHDLGEKIEAFCLTERDFCEGHGEWSLKNVTFLFNIREKI